MATARAATGESTSADLSRQVVVAASAGLAVVGSVLGSGVFVGTPIDEAAGGALAADATLVAPAGPAFSIWSVIYAGLVAFAVFQLLPSRRDDPRQRRVGWLVAASMLLNAAWVLVVQLGWLWISVAVIAVLLAVLVAAFVRLLRTRPSSRLEAVVVDGTVNLYLGWVTIATVANVAAAVAAQGVRGAGLGADIWAVVVLGLAGAVGLGLAVVSRGRLGVAASLAWGLAWIAAARLGGDSVSVPAAVAAVAAAALVVLGTAWARLSTARLV